MTNYKAWLIDRAKLLLVSITIAAVLFLGGLYIPHFWSVLLFLLVLKAALDLVITIKSKLK